MPAADFASAGGQLAGGALDYFANQQTMREGQDFTREMVQQQGHTATIMALAGLGADVKAADKKGKTALIYAAEKGHSEAAKVLVSLKADVKAADNDGMTAVMYAAQGGHTATVKELAGLVGDVAADKDSFS